MGCLFSNAMAHKPWQYKSNAVVCKETRSLKNKFPLSLPPHEEMMSHHIETTADAEMQSPLIFHWSYYEMSYFSAWV